LTDSQRVTPVTGLNALPRPFLLSAVLAMVGTLAIACGGGGGGGGPTPDSQADGGPPPELTVVTTLPVFADFAREAGGDRVEVFTILPDGLDPPLLELSGEDSERVRSADVILFNGLELENTAEDLLFQHARRAAPIFEYSRDVPSPTVEGLTAREARDNPYLWLDPILALTYMDTTWDTLAIADGEATSIYQENARRYGERLRALDEEIAAKVEAIPPANRRLVAPHDSFFHLANRYGLESVRLPTAVSTDQPSPHRIDQWAELLREQQVPAIFVEPGPTAKVLTEAAQRAGVEVCTLYSDSLDEVVTTYIEMMTFNADELVRCLGGD